MGRQDVETLGHEDSQNPLLIYRQTPQGAGGEERPDVKGKPEAPRSRP
jgi:hypothetical protein